MCNPSLSSDEEEPPPPPPPPLPPGFGVLGVVAVLSYPTAYIEK